MVHEPVDGRQRHGLVGENLAPFAEGLVGRDEQGPAFIAGGDQLFWDGRRGSFSIR
jgi:hypothetical protein